MHAPTTAHKGGATPLSVLEPDARVQGIPEAVVQEIWASGEFDFRDLTTTAGDAVTILNHGRLNRDGGPDFTAAQLRIGIQTASNRALSWTGDIEIHRTSGEWLLHRHHEDAKYNRVILHVVLLEDRHTGSLRRADGTVLPEIVLYPRLASSLRSLLHRFYTAEQKGYYCEESWAEVPAHVKEPWLKRLGMKRVRSRASKWAVESPGLSLDELLYRGVLRALGYSKNAEPMSELARRIPLNLLRSQSDLMGTEALLFGVSGLLPELSEMLQADRHSTEYVQNLRDRFERSQQNSPLPPMSKVAWQYFRLRPANFPTLRIAQAAALLAPMTSDTPGGVLSGETLESLREALASDRPWQVLQLLLRTALPSPFWAEHVRFEQRSPAGSTGIGADRANRLLMDAILPVMLLDAEQRGDMPQEERIGIVMNHLPAASDEVTRLFKKHGSIPKGALGTQGLHQLYRSWCSEGRCLSCEVGRHVLSQSAN